jgi:YVTN family beta-propeller protein
VQLRLALAGLVLLLPNLSGKAADEPPLLRPAIADPVYLSPSALVATPDGKQLFVACATASRVLAFDPASERVTGKIVVPASPQGLALSPDGSQLFVTCAAPRSTVCVVDVASGKVLRSIPAGHTTLAPVCSPDGRTLYVCDRFNDCVGVIDLKAQKEIARIPVPREPISSALSADGKLLLVANHLHAGRADVDQVAACVIVIDTAARKVLTNIPLPNGSTIVRDIRISPGGDVACMAHGMGKFYLPTTQIERGWIANNALSFIHLKRQCLLNTVLLDNIDQCAANPWAVAWTADGKQICVTHAGTHELSVIDAPALLRKLAACGACPSSGAAGSSSSNSVEASVAAVPASVAAPGDGSAPAHDLTFLAGLRQRVALNQKGPRSVAIIGSKAYVGNYFSDSLSVVDLAAPSGRARTIALGPEQPLSVVRQGELAFNDASLCFQGWQSCASCHSSDARVDGLNWDLLNDGLGNPKNVRSLLFAHRTPPTMALGVRANAQLAVRAGFRNILFTVPPEETAAAVDAYLESLRPAPSPLLENGKFSKAAARGRKLFLDEKVACASCHSGELYTDLKPYDVGTGGKFDKPQDKFYTPTLVELWRTAPYLHDGSAATMRDVLTIANQNDRHGKTSHLTERQIEDLAAYLLSL